MIAHVVLFRPKPSLSTEQRTAFLEAIQGAFTNIPAIKRATIGRRRVLGRAYDDQNREEFQYAAFLEFERESDLRDYLEHPAHTSLGEQFYVAAELALVFDYELLDCSRTRELGTPDHADT
jgi:hypothetical protein